MSPCLLVYPATTEGFSVAEASSILNGEELHLSALNLK